MTKTNDIFLDRLPSIDLHGFDKESAIVAVNDFVLESHLQNNEEILIIHGIGTGILKNAVQETLKKNKLVIEYKISSSNVGCTVVKILTKWYDCAKI